MIGQEKLIKRLNNYTVDNFPRSSLLIGEKGIGKHTLVKYISENVLKLSVVDLTENITNEVIDNIYRLANPAIYMVDITDKTEKDQNVLLKFVEEPLANSFVFILVENENFILNTLLNRCIIFNLEPYTTEELKTFLPEDVDEQLVLSVLRTPGKIKSCNLHTLDATKELSDKIANKLHLAPYQNALSISSKINYKDEYDKIDMFILLDMLSNSLFNKFLETNDISTYRKYELLLKHKKQLIDKRLNKELFVENLITDLWLDCHG